MAHKAKLILESSTQPNQEFPLRGTQLTLGRDVTNDIVLDDQKVSRLHARLEYVENAWVVYDAGSANGVFVDDQRVEQTTLHSGNVIKIGNSLLRFSHTPSARRQAKSTTPGHQLIGQFLDDLASNKEPAESTTPLRDKLLHIPRLVITTPGKTWEVKLMGQESWRIGRSADNDIVIDHQKVSRHHAKIERQDDHFVIHDLGSANGTRLGTKQIERHPLQHTDTLNIGHAQLMFKDVGQLEQIAAVKPKSERAPVIVVPGVFGSVLWRGSEQVWPNIQTMLRTPEKLYYTDNDQVKARGILDNVVVVPKLIEIEAYHRIGDYLEKSLHYHRGQDLLEFAYDWRGDVREAAQSLAEMVDRWSVDQPITLIAHSLGCLVARYYIDCLGGDRHVGRLILMGGPNYGSPQVLPNLLPDRLGHLRTPMGALGGMFGEKIIRMFMTFPYAYQMLPVSQDVFDQHNNPINLYEDNSWLPTAESHRYLDAGRELHQALNKRATVSTICIFGYGITTPVRINITRDSTGQWQSMEVSTSKDGDGMIPASSAVLEGAEIHPVQQDHNQLYVDEDVLMRLKYELTS